MIEDSFGKIVQVRLLVIRVPHNVSLIVGEYRFAGPPKVERVNYGQS